MLATAAIDALQESPAIVPHHWHSEVANGLLVGERRKVTTEAQTADFLARLSRLPIQTDDSPVGSRHDIILGLARRYSLTVYDAAYLELALRQGGILASFDSDLIKAARAADCPVFGD
jgi:predicted nucleic acid-binding protein